MSTRQRKTDMEENKNPQIVIDALTEAPKKFKKFELSLLTIFKYAWLERLNSPFIDGTKEFTIDNIVPTIYVLANDKSVLKKYGTDVDALKADALDWADDNLEIDDMPQVIKAVVAVFTSINKAAPSSAGSDGTKKN